MGPPPSIPPFGTLKNNLVWIGGGGMVPPSSHFSSGDVKPDAKSLPRQSVAKAQQGMLSEGGQAKVAGRQRRREA